MARALPRTSFNSSRLLRLLADLAIADVMDSKQSFAERLGQWLDFTDAISLSATLNATGSSPSDGPLKVPSGESAALVDEFVRVRSALVDSITTDGVFQAGRTRIKLPTPSPGASIENAADFSPYRRYYLAHQRDMDSTIGPLRTHVRMGLSRLSPALKQLAALDAVLERTLAARERTLLSTVPALLEKHFGLLYKAHQETHCNGQVEDNPDLWMLPGGWLTVFCKDMQNVLLAELDLRLQPVTGLIEVVSNEVTKHQ